MKTLANQLILRGLKMKTSNKCIVTFALLCTLTAIASSQFAASLAAGEADAPGRLDHLFAARREFALDFRTSLTEDATPAVLL